MAGIRLEHMTWQEADAARARYEVLLLPLGARLKEHGPHLPLNTDWLLAERLAARVLERCDVLALPTLELGHYPAFVEYPGSVSLSPETATAVLVELSRSFARHGWRKVYVLNTGISTLRALEPARAVLATEGVTLAFTDLSAALAEVEAEVAEQARGSHADEVETSMLLHLAPEVVRFERAERDDEPRRGPGPFTRDPTATTGVFSRTGAWGDPTLASAEKGRRVVDALVERLVAEVEALRSGGAPP